MGTIGDGTGSHYGSGVFDQANLLAAGDVMTAANNNDIQQVALQSQVVLGLTPQGGSGSVQARLEAIEASLATLTAASYTAVQTTSVTLTAGVGTPEDLYTFSIPAGTLAVGDALAFTFYGFSTQDNSGDVDVYLRLDTSDEITLDIQNAFGSPGLEPWHCQGSLAIQSTSGAVMYGILTSHFPTQDVRSRANTVAVTTFDGTGAFDFIFRAERAATDTVFSVEAATIQRIPA